MLTLSLPAHRQCARTEAAKAAARKRASENDEGKQITEISLDDAAAALEEGMLILTPSLLVLSIWSTIL